MSTTAAKYRKLKGDTDVNSLQLIYPTDLASDESYVPHVVIFEPNVIVGHRVDYTRTLTAPKNEIQGSYGSEVALNTSIGAGSIRASKGFSDIKTGKTNATYKKTQEKIVLPMTNTFNITYASQWQSVDIGALGRGLDFVNSMKEHSYGVLAEQAGDAAKRSLAGAVQSLGIANVKDYLELTTGASANNYTEVLFKGMGNRIIPFSYTFTPRNLKEAEIIRRIIHRFKFHQMPEYKYSGNNNSYLLHPSTFDISFIDLDTGKTNGWVNKVATCALTNLSINGTPNGEYSVTTDGAPTAVTIELLFTELITLTKDIMRDATDSF